VVEVRRDILEETDGPMLSACREVRGKGQGPSSWRSGTRSSGRRAEDRRP
jgi:hypothetical protein